MSKDGFEINYEVSALDAALKEQLRALQNRRPLMRGLSGMLYSAVMDNFDHGGRPAWQPLKPATVRRKQKAGKERLLIMSNHLRNSITPYHDDNSAIVGTNVPYARIHQEGGLIKMKARSQTTFHRIKKDGRPGHRFAAKARADFAKTHPVAAHSIHIPARPFLALTEAEAQRLTEHVRNYLIAQIFRNAK